MATVHFGRFGRGTVGAVPVCNKRGFGSSVLGQISSTISKVLSDRKRQKVLFKQKMAVNGR